MRYMLFGLCMGTLEAHHTTLCCWVSCNIDRRLIWCPPPSVYYYPNKASVTITIRARFELDMRSIRARFENPVTIAIRFDMRSIRARFEPSRKEWTCSIFSIIESNRARIELESSSNRIVCHNYDSSSIRESCHNCDSIRYALDLSSIRARFELDSRISHSRIESQLWQGSRIESSSNRAHIELESSSNRNCDWRLTQQALGNSFKRWATRSFILFQQLVLKHNN